MKNEKLTKRRCPLIFHFSFFTFHFPDPRPQTLDPLNLLPKILLVCTLILLLACSACSRGPHYVFAVVGDLQQPGARPYRAATYEIARRLAAGDARLVVIVGDLIDGASPAQWDEFDRLVKPIRDAGKEIYAVIGNHDNASPETAAGFEARFPRRQVIHQPGLALVMLDSEAQSGDRDWSLGDEQTAWLRTKPWSTGATEAHPLLFFFVHRPPHRSKFFAELDPQQRFLPEKADLARLLVDSGADAVFSGHEHLYSRRKFDDVDFIISGGGGGDLLKGAYHYLLITVYPEARKWKLKKVNVEAGQTVYAQRPSGRE